MVLRFRLWLARWLLRETGHQVIASEPLRACEQAMVGLHRMTYSSGHLTRAYHVGRALRKHVELALDKLLESQERLGYETNDSYVSPPMRQDLYG
jgi:hypothetical protein